jgi:hypothetical protein
VAERPTNTVECVDFDLGTFIDLVLEYSGSVGEAPNEQTKYLAAYLDRLGAETLVVESHYIDRHFMEEVGLYYSSRLQSVPNSCARIHVFAVPLDDRQLDRRLAEYAATPERTAKKLEKDYLGFIVVRPVPTVPIGRTVLSPLRDDSQRRFPTSVDYKVHFLGIELRIRGLAFQQQDRAVAACATTALWTSLQRVSRHEGDRTPTPSSITISGDQYVPPAGRALPSPGLSVGDMKVAFRRYGFSSMPIAPAGDINGFQVLLHIYLRSGIPVVLTTRPDGGEGHAVAVVGYKAQPSLPELKLVPGKGRRQTGAVRVLAHNLAFTRLYVHDDRIGPYARAALVEEAGSQRVLFQIVFPDERIETEPVDSILAPLYAKVRLPGHDLWGCASALYAAMAARFESLLAVRKRAKTRAKRLFGLEIFYERSGDYLSGLFGKVVKERLARFVRTAALSRYVAVLRWYHPDGAPLVDLVLDTTDILREDPVERLAAIVALSEDAVPDVEALARAYGVTAC